MVNEPNLDSPPPGRYAPRPMKRALLIAIAVAGCARPVKPSWEAGAAFERATPLSPRLVTAEMRDRRVQLEGTVGDVCQGSGCWVEVVDGDRAVIAKSLDHGVLFPTDCGGRRVLIDGIVRVDPESACGDHDEGDPGHRCPDPDLLVEITGAKLY